jgi:hypothetical protein
MRKRCQVAGVVFADVRWDPERECLCTYELWHDDQWHLERELRDAAGQPRQVNEGDIKEIESRMRGRSAAVDAWFRRFKNSKARHAAGCASHRREVAAETARNLRDYSHRQKKHFAGGVQNYGDDPILRRQDTCQHKMVRRDCPDCSPDLMPLQFSMAAKSGSAANGIVKRGDE